MPRRSAKCVVMGWWFWVMGCRLRVAGFGLRVLGFGFCGANLVLFYLLWGCGLRVGGWFVVIGFLGFNT